jgi:glutamyl-Q tRNA(Asp) synthetase
MISTDDSAIVTRFAPSPTGRLHPGHAFSAIRAHDFARARGGRFLLRIEDIDSSRSRAEFVAGIEEDLRWLGLAWDGAVVRQSMRLDAYRGALGALGAAGLLYPCFCTRADIAGAASAPHGPEGPVYPGTCRALDPATRAARMEREAHAWRIAMDRAVAQTGPLRWHDGEAGEVAADPARFGDVVLARKDAPASYHLAVTVDDAWQRVTDVVRGADLFEATHIHRLLQALLGLPSPRYHHHPLLVDAGGERLAKRRGSASLADLRAKGSDPLALVEALRKGEIPMV